MSLTAQARKLHPNRRNGAKWVMAIRYLRRKNLWVLDKFSRKPTWTLRQCTPLIVATTSAPDPTASRRSETKCVMRFLTSKPSQLCSRNLPSLSAESTSAIVAAYAKTVRLRQQTFRR